LYIAPGDSVCFNERTEVTAEMYSVLGRGVKNPITDRLLAKLDEQLEAVGIGEGMAMTFDNWSKLFSLPQNRAGQWSVSLGEAVPELAAYL